MMFELKINLKKLVFQLKVRYNIKTWNEQKSFRMWNVAPLLNTSLFTLKFFCTFAKQASYSN